MHSQGDTHVNVFVVREGELSDVVTTLAFTEPVNSPGKIPVLQRLKE